MEKKNETAIAKYIFTDVEKIEKGIELTEEMSNLQVLEAQLKYETKEYKSKIESVQSKIAVLKEKVSNGFEFRKYMCDVVLDFENRKRLYRRVDNGEIIKESPLEAEDYQLKMLEDEKVEKTRKRDELFAKNGVPITEEGQVIINVNEDDFAEEAKRKELGEKNFKKWEDEELAKQKAIRQQEGVLTYPDPVQ